MIIIKNNYNAGFSLMELIVYVGVLGIVSVMVAGMFVTFNRISGQVEVRNEVNSNLRFAMEKISQDLRSASVVATPTTAGASSSNLVMTISGTTVEYCVAGGYLRRQTVTACDASSGTITSDKVTVNTPTFTRMENTNSVLADTAVSVQINFTITSLNTVGGTSFSSNKRTVILLK